MIHPPQLSYLHLRLYLHLHLHLHLRLRLHLHLHPRPLFYYPSSSIAPPFSIISPPRITA